MANKPSETNNLEKLFSEIADKISEVEQALDFIQQAAFMRDDMEKLAEKASMHFLRAQEGCEA